MSSSQKHHCFEQLDDFHTVPEEQPQDRPYHAVNWTK